VKAKENPIVEATN